MKYFWQIFSVCAIVVIIGLGVFIYNKGFKKDNAEPWIPEEYVIDAEIVDVDSTLFTVKVITSECGHEEGEIIQVWGDKRHYYGVGTIVRIITGDRITEEDRNVGVHSMTKVSQ